MIKGQGLSGLGGNLGCGSACGGILTGNLHLKDVVGLFGILHFGIGQERHDESSEGAKSALVFSLGQGVGSDEVVDPKTFESTLEVTFGIASVITGVCTKEARGVCVNQFGDALGRLG